VTAGAWPLARVRHERLAEAVTIIRELMGGDYVNFSGRHFQVERAKLFDLPETPVPIGIALSGPESVALAVGADHQDQFMTWAAQELLPALREI
jgi:alkanesulfonate monooxygenase SsuD/methylene tetrahydromethanopterin reductase-like flavin-dependent oxidoreductase (luciferase family)